MILAERLTAFESVAASDTDEELVAAVTGKAIRVASLVCLAGGTATDVTFESGDSTPISPPFSLGANIPLVLDPDPAGWFETAPGESLTVTTGTGSTVGVLVNYVLVP